MHYRKNIKLLYLHFTFVKDSVGVVSGFRRGVNENVTLWDVIQRRLEFCYRHCGTTYRPPSSRIKQCAGPFTIRDILEQHIL